MQGNPAAAERFGPRNLALVRVGLSEADVRKLFGYPDNVELARCRPEEGEAWSCKILWYYRGLEANAFCFQEDEDGVWALNSFEIHFQDPAPATGDP